MNIIKSLIQFLKKNKKHEKNNSPEGLCPNCWGREEYGGKFYEAVKNANLDIKSKNPNVGWIQAYVKNNLYAIQLQNEDEKLVCPNCKINYKKTDK